MFGSPLPHGRPLLPVHALVRITGTALRIPALLLRKQLAHCASLQVELGRYLYLLIAQTAQSAACMRLHSVQERLSLSLLTTHDRVRGEAFRLSHETLAGMLGVQRSAISLAAAQLQRRGLIRYSRGIIDIVDRPGLEQMSCGCYAWSIKLAGTGF